jgi:aspartyl-tRNA(Asn)/glutamyl-tRNA(Gln) amidotransferase subunit B
MEEGSLRCDANVSIRLRGEKELGTKVEVKNLNSIRNVKKAIEYEIERMIQLVESGGKVQQQTRSFDASNDTTFSIRDKEEANDYRYFPDPDLAPFHLTDEYIQNIQSSLPALPNELIHKFQSQYGLSEYDARQLCDEKGTAQYFEAVIQHTLYYKSIANWILGPIRQLLNEEGLSIESFAVKPASLAELILLVEEGKVSFSTASSKILPVLVVDKGSPLSIAEKLNLVQVSDTNELAIWIADTLAAMPDKVIEYKKGKKGLMGLFVGEVKKRSKGKADAKLVTQLLEETLNA